MNFFDRLFKFDLSLITGDEVSIMLIGYLIVFLVLAALYIVFLNLPKALNFVLGLGKSSKAKNESMLDAPTKASAKVKQGDLTGAESAAITAAIHLFINDNFHDEEDAILTIQKVSRRYSPWSSKIYSVTNYRR